MEISYPKKKKNKTKQNKKDGTSTQINHKKYFSTWKIYFHYFIHRRDNVFSTVRYHKSAL